MARCGYCDVSMQVELHGYGRRLAIDCCSTCDRIWFDHNELSAYLRRVAKHDHVGRDTDISFRRRLASDRVSCPRCSAEVLSPCFLGRVKAHWCAACFGVLVQSEELEGVVPRPRFWLPSFQNLENDVLLRVEAAEPSSSIAEAIAEFVGELFG